jgi:predicted molibdopterin-dependent oxidoreductase YjgC
VNSHDRLTTPLVKTDQGFKEATWDEALGLVADKLSAIKAQDPDQIGFFTSARCTNEDNYALMKFSRAVIGTNNVDNCARV